MYVFLYPHDAVLDAAVCEARETLPDAPEDEITALACLLASFYLDALPMPSRRYH